MFSINSKLLAQVLTQIRTAFGWRRASYFPVTLEVNRDSITVRASNGETSIACQIPGGGRGDCLTIPMCTFAAIKSSARHDVRFSAHGQRARIEWWEAGEQQSTYCEVAPDLERPTAPEWLLSNPRELGQVLQQAAQLTDPDSMRFSLGCIRLRGTNGQIAATDGRQAFTHSGFAIPVDEVLVPAAALAKLKCLGKCTSISVGRSADWLTVSMAVGPLRWLVDLQIFHKGRFPCVDQCIPQLPSARTTLTISERDAAYLIDNLECFIGKPREHSPLTLDLVGRNEVLIRFCSHGGVLPAEYAALAEDYRGSNSIVAELALASSSCDAYPLRLATDHRYLLQAVNLGFRQIHFQAANFPAFCEDSHRHFVWALAQPTDAIQATPSTLRLSTSLELAAA